MSLVLGTFYFQVFHFDISSQYIRHFFLQDLLLPSNNKSVEGLLLDGQCGGGGLSITKVKVQQVRLGHFMLKFKSCLKDIDDFYQFESLTSSFRSSC
jgi:hypothetical protein